MKNNGGVLRRPSERKLESKRPVFLVGLLSVILIVSYIFTIKTYEPVNNVLITGGVIVYPFTFLIISYISKYYGFKESRKAIFISAALFLLFMILTMVSLIPTPNNETSSYNAVIQYLYANDFFMIGDTRIFMPMLGQFFGIGIAFIVSHLLYATIYNAIHNYTIDYLAMGLSVFIAGVVDKIIFMTLFFAENLIDGVNTFEYFIKCLTSEFIATIISSIAMIIIYVIINAFKENKKKKRLVA